jgi:hypothetical protein
MENQDKKPRLGLRNKLKELINPINLSGIVVGALAGFIYFKQIGCLSGDCPITSKAYLTILWGALIGFLIADIISQSLKKKK